jgi:hypothetical protein
VREGKTGRESEGGGEREEEEEYDLEWPGGRRRLIYSRDY